jgi:DNA-binding response OmpR family regulator
VQDKLDEARAAQPYKKQWRFFAAWPQVAERRTVMATRIMVINDTQEILELFEEILREEGYEVVLYSQAIQDMSEIERIKPDLIIVDYIFGGERTGWQLVQKLRMRRATAKIPLIICTAAVKEVREIEGFLRMKGIGLVAKPFDIDDLLEAIKTALQTAGSSAALVDSPSEEGRDPD